MSCRLFDSPCISGAKVASDGSGRTGNAILILRSTTIGYRETGKSKGWEYANGKAEKDVVA